MKALVCICWQTSCKVLEPVLNSSSSQENDPKWVLKSCNPVQPMCPRDLHTKDDTQLKQIGGIFPFLLTVDPALLGHWEMSTCQDPHAAARPHSSTSVTRGTDRKDSITPALHHKHHNSVVFQGAHSKCMNHLSPSLFCYDSLPLHSLMQLNGDCTGVWFLRLWGSKRGLVSPQRIRSFYYRLNSSFFVTITILWRFLLLGECGLNDKDALYL